MAECRNGSEARLLGGQERRRFSLRWRVYSVWKDFQVKVNATLDDARTDREPYVAVRRSRVPTRGDVKKTTVISYYHDDMRSSRSKMKSRRQPQHSALNGQLFQQVQVARFDVSLHRAVSVILNLLVCFLHESSQSPQTGP
jgi:hypothetical protein